MKKKAFKILMIFDLEYLNLDHLEKDMFLIMSALGKRFNRKSEIIYRGNISNINMPKNIRDTILTRIKIPFNIEPFRLFYYAFYLILNASKTEIFVKYYFSYYTGILGFVYKLINKSGIFYVKSDGIQICSKNRYFNLISNKSFKAKIQCRILRLIFKWADIISIETKKDYEDLLILNPFGIDISKKLILMRNGFDENLLESYRIREKNINEKENILLTVGRIGHPDKNNEMLLNAIRKLSNMKKWKFVFIGNIEFEFKKVVNDFFLENPTLLENVIFTGPIYDKKELWEWYNRAKVFVLTSPSESYGLVLNEAFRFSNYIISTNVGIAAELIEYGYGEITSFDDSTELMNKIQNVIQHNNLLCLKLARLHYDRKVNSWDCVISEVESIIKKNKLI